ncbi:MAG: F0F1 ATP synthase subunit A [Ruminococcus sp.]|nr:F0F1 ATP synthase subunit A [Ruminococcus sp.]
MAEELIEELENKVAFTIPIFGGIPIADSCVVTWIIMGVLVLLSIILTRNLKKVPTGVQCLLESFIGMLDKMFTEALGEGGKRYVPILETFILYIGMSNIMGIFGFVPPTKDVNVTAALAGLAIILVQVAFILKKGPLKWLKSFINPLNVLDLVTRPLSLCMRLFGNVLAAHIVMELIKIAIRMYVHVPAIGVPLIASAYFDIFDGILQAYVFSFLTSLYLAEAIEDEEGHEGKKAKKRKKLHGGN